MVEDKASLVFRLAESGSVFGWSSMAESGKYTSSGVCATDLKAIKLERKKLVFSGSGCVISQATASMLTEHCIGKNVEEVLALTKDDILKLIGIELGPVRLKCALLALQALQQGIIEFENCEKKGSS